LQKTKKRTIRRISDESAPPALSCLYKSDFDLDLADGVSTGLWDDLAFERFENERLVAIGVGELLGG
jgi:hypothetical protein